MYCPNCGKNIKESEVCPECGKQINIQNKKESEVVISGINISAQTSSQPKNNNQTTKINDIKEKIIKNKKQVTIAVASVLGVIVILLLYNAFIGFEKLSWDNKYLDKKTTCVTQSIIKLGIKFSNPKKANLIKYTTNCGKVKSSGLKLSWNLTDSKGKCQITARYKGKKISKELTITTQNMDEEELYLDYEIDESSDEDLDLDGLTNKQEKEYNTNPELSDSDLDGLDDYYEIFTSKTDPNKKDTDGDGLNDYDEIQLGLDPTKADSNGDGIKDGQRTLTYNYKTDKVQINITGKGNIASITANVNTNTKITDKVGLIDNLYTLYADATIEEAELTVFYTDEELKAKELNEDNLSIYYYNPTTSTYEKIPSTVNKENKTVTATLKHFSDYVVGDETKVKEKVESEILFVLDNSWSMYSVSQYEEYSGKKYSTTLGELVGNDQEGKRFSLTSELVKRLSKKNFKIGLSEFRRDYANAVSIGTDYDKITSQLTKMQGKFITKSEGTNIGIAISSGIDEFSSDSANKYIVILTDGDDNAGLYYKKKSLINSAISKNVKICSIGFGEGAANSELSNISNSTGCKFYSAANAMGLEELFDNLGTEVDDGQVDIDGDGIIDGTLIADSGFIVNRDGFSFKNYGTNLANGGHCYGMATFAELYYRNVLPLQLDSKTVKKDKSYAYNLSNSHFTNYSSLYDYKLKSEILKYTFGFDYFGKEAPTDLRVISNNNYIYKDEFKKELEASKVYDIELKTTSQAQRKEYDNKFKKHEKALLNEDKMQTNSIINKDDRNLLNAIYASYIKQNQDEYYASGTDFYIWLRDLTGKAPIVNDGKAGFINVLTQRLQAKDPVVLSAFFTSGYHAINAITLVQDNKNPNIYYIGVYDNNYPGEKRYVDIECNSEACFTKKNKYYSREKEVIRITESLEKDLAYFN